MRRALPTVIFVWLVILACVVLFGCAPKSKQPTTRQEITVAGGFAKTAAGYKGATEYVGKLRGTPLTERQEDYVTGVSSGIGLMNEGTTEAQKACEAAVKENDSSRQGFYRWTDRASFMGGIALAVGLALIVMGIVNGQKIGLGVGIAVLGGSLVAVFLTIRSAAPVLPWVMAGVGVLAVGGFGYFVYERIMARRERLRREEHARLVAEQLAERESQLAVEQLATKELQESVKTALTEVPDDAKPRVLDKLANEVQSPTTQILAAASAVMPQTQPV